MRSHTRAILLAVIGCISSTIALPAGPGGVVGTPSDAGLTKPGQASGGQPAQQSPATQAVTCATGNEICGAAGFNGFTGNLVSFFRGQARLNLNLTSYGAMTNYAANTVIATSGLASGGVMNPGFVSASVTAPATSLQILQAFSALNSSGCALCGKAALDGVNLDNGQLLLIGVSDRPPNCANDGICPANTYQMPTNYVPPT